MEKDKDKGKIFIVPVPACDSWSLLTVINDWILPGSVIISNCWKAYDCLKLQEFVQQTVIQSKTFVHPQNQSVQQNFDGKNFLSLNFACVFLKINYHKFCKNHEKKL